MTQAAPSQRVRLRCRPIRLYRGWFWLGRDRGAVLRAQDRRFESREGDDRDLVAGVVSSPSRTRSRAVSCDCVRLRKSRMTVSPSTTAKSFWLSPSTSPVVFWVAKKEIRTSEVLELQPYGRGIILNAGQQDAR